MHKLILPPAQDTEKKEKKCRDFSRTTKKQNYNKTLESEIFSCSAIEIDSFAITHSSEEGSCLISFLLHSNDRLTHKSARNKLRLNDGTARERIKRREKKRVIGLRLDYMWWGYNNYLLNVEWDGKSALES